MATARKLGLRTVAVYSEADKASKHVQARVRASHRQGLVPMPHRTHPSNAEVHCYHPRADGG